MARSGRAYTAEPPATPEEGAELRGLLPQARAGLGPGLTGVLVAALRPVVTGPDAPAGP